MRLGNNDNGDLFLEIDLSKKVLQGLIPVYHCIFSIIESYSINSILGQATMIIISRLLRLIICTWPLKSKDLSSKTKSFRKFLKTCYCKSPPTLNKGFNPRASDNEHFAQQSFLSACQFWSDLTVFSLHETVFLYFWVNFKKFLLITFCLKFLKIADVSDFLIECSTG